MLYSSAQLSDALFQKFAVIIFKNAGISLKPEKKELLAARLGKRLRLTGIGSFQEYYDYITQYPDSEEFIHFIDVISTNFTSFFRESSHFDFLTNNILPKFAVSKSGGKQIQIWSAACSSGEEPYTIAMVFEDYFSTHTRMNYRILATDISFRVLNQATRGVYSMDRVAKLPITILKKYFQRGSGNSDGFVRIKNTLRQYVVFEHFNLMHEFPWHESMDVIFCRNVMIYFERATQQELIEKFYKALVPGGYLFIGHSESISGIKHQFRQLEATTYQK